MKISKKTSDIKEAFEWFPGTIEGLPGTIEGLKKALGMYKEEILTSTESRPSIHEIAIAAMQGVISNGWTNIDTIVRESYNIAGAMIQEGKRRDK
jgi:hypothetical protein